MNLNAYGFKLQYFSEAVIQWHKLTRPEAKTVETRDNAVKSHTFNRSLERPDNFRFKPEV